MGVYRRGDSQHWWIAFHDETGKRRLVSAETTDREEAESKLAAILKMVGKRKKEASQRAALEQVEARAPAPASPITFEKFARQWVAGRKKRDLATWSDDEDRLNHVMPVLGKMPLADIRVRHIQAAMDALREVEEKKRLAPRTLHHVYGAMRGLFREAMKQELVLGNPCILSVRAGELPKKRDKKPGWRSQAKFSRAEVELLLSNTRVPEVRRVLWGILFLTGARIGEATDLRWTDIDYGAEPLARIQVDSSYVTRKHRVRLGGKTGVEREVPLHPTLAALLARWKLQGWKDWTKDAEKPVEDRIVPGPRGGPLSATTSLEWFHHDLDTLGLRQRRQHDARRTFVSLWKAAGGNPEVVRLVTWAEARDVESLYTTFDWKFVCGELLKLDIRLREGAVIALHPQTAATLLLRQP
jgi:integrase